MSINLAAASFRLSGLCHNVIALLGPAGWQLLDQSTPSFVTNRFSLQEEIEAVASPKISELWEPF